MTGVPQAERHFWRLCWGWAITACLEQRPGAGKRAFSDTAKVLLERDPPEPLLFHILGRARERASGAAFAISRVLF